LPEVRGARIRPGSREKRKRVKVDRMHLGRYESSSDKRGRGVAGKDYESPFKNRS